MASFYPAARYCVLQVIAGRTLLEPQGLQNESEFAGLVFVIIGVIGGAAMLGVAMLLLWRWFARHGKMPLGSLKATITNALGWRDTKRGNARTVSRKYLLGRGDTELELAASAAAGSGMTGGGTVQHRSLQQQGSKASKHACTHHTAVPTPTVEWAVLCWCDRMHGACMGNALHQ